MKEIILSGSHFEVTALVFEQETFYMQCSYLTRLFIFLKRKSRIKYLESYFLLGINLSLSFSLCIYVCIYIYIYIYIYIDIYIYIFFLHWVIRALLTSPIFKKPCNPFYTLGWRAPIPNIAGINLTYF